MTRFLIEFPADDTVRAQSFWAGLLGAALEQRGPDDGTGWQADHEGIVVGLHQRGTGPGDRFSLPYFAVGDLAATLERVLALGGEIIHPGDRSAVCRDSEGTPFGLIGQR